MQIWAVSKFIEVITAFNPHHGYNLINKYGVLSLLLGGKDELLKKKKKIPINISSNENISIHFCSFFVLKTKIETTQKNGSFRKLQEIERIC